MQQLKKPKSKKQTNLKNNPRCRFNEMLKEREDYICQADRMKMEAKQTRPTNEAKPIVFFPFFLFFSSSLLGFEPKKLKEGSSGFPFLLV